MKKLLSLILCLILIFTIGSVGASAATNYCELFDDKIGSLRWAIVLGDNEEAVAEGQAFGTKTIISFCQMQLNSKYFDTNNEFYYIPADEFEKMAKGSFAVCNISALRAATYSYWIENQETQRNHYNAQKNAYEFPSAGGLGDSTAYIIQGYIKNGSKYTVYSHFVDQAGDEIPAGKVEGKDYIVLNDVKCLIIHSLKNVVETDGTNVKFHSWEKVSSVPSGLITPTTKVEDEKPTTPSKPSDTTSKPSQITAPDSSAGTTGNQGTTPSDTAAELVTVAKTDGALIESEKDVFPEDTVVTVEEIKETEKIDSIKASLKDVSQKFVAFEITAQSQNTSVQPNGKVKATFNIPDGYDLGKIAVFYVADDGKTEKLASSVDKASKTVVAELSHFSTYVVAETEQAEETEEDTAVSTENTQKADKNNSALIWIIIAAVVIVLVGGGLAFYFLVFKKKTQ